MVKFKIVFKGEYEQYPSRCHGKTNEFKFDFFNLQHLHLPSKFVSSMQDGGIEWVNNIEKFELILQFSNLRVLEFDSVTELTFFQEPCCEPDFEQFCGQLINSYVSQLEKLTHLSGAGGGGYFISFPQMIQWTEMKQLKVLIVQNLKINVTLDDYRKFIRDECKYTPYIRLTTVKFKCRSNIWSFPEDPWHQKNKPPLKKKKFCTKLHQ
jgi:hypothetical protein